MTVEWTTQLTWESFLVVMSDPKSRTGDKDKAALSKL